MRILPFILVISLGCPEPQNTWEPHIVCDENAPATMGRTPLKRLTRTQYDHSVHDVLGVTGAFSPILVEDEQVGVFASNSTVAVDMTTIQLYQAAAEAVAGAADLGRIDNCNLLTTRGTDCAERYIDTVGRQLYRRPLTDDETRTFESLYATFGSSDHLIIRTIQKSR